ncbi:helix-turn-helix domain-containing protein [Carboxylicivirga marina]|uniref:helix-turn-helix domain-containing protein n=1 Tax=Carboxylicivirga marina TaxID=2800988 RepID=UPI00259838A2|nr:helix-turn-helix transcriptional regulator [uncultured Carboxylicivirga sp.]
MNLNPKDISELVLSKLKSQKISQQELATKIEVSRSGLRKMLENPGSFKLETLNKIFQELTIDWNEITDNFNVNSEMSKLNLSQTKLLGEYLLKHNRDSLQLFFNVGDEKLNDIELDLLPYEDWLSLCTYFNIPFELIKKEKFKRYYKGISISNYFNNKELILQQQLKIGFEITITETKLKIIDFINQSVQKVNFSLSNNKNYQETIEWNGESSNFSISIITENCNCPIVFISNSPSSFLPVQHFIEELCSRVYDKHFSNNPSYKERIIWVETSYFSSSSLNVSFVKFNDNSSFANPVWSVIRSANDSQLIINPKEVKEFLNMK